MGKILTLEIPMLMPDNNIYQYLYCNEWIRDFIEEDNMVYWCDENSIVRIREGNIRGTVETEKVPDSEFCYIIKSNKENDK